MKLIRVEVSAYRPCVERWTVAVPDDWKYGGGDLEQILRDRVGLVAVEETFAGEMESRKVMEVKEETWS